MSTSNGTFVWYELMTTNADAAETFYPAVVGWRARDAGMPGMRYTILSVGEAGVAGIMTLPQEACAAGARPGWIGYIGVDDVDAAASRVEQAGGTVHKPAEDIPGVGRFAVVADPQGASFVLFRGSSEQPPQRPAPGVPGSPGWPVVADPQGASFVLFRGSSEQPPQRPAPGVPGSPGWHELHAGEWQSAFAFYADLFGWRKAEAVDMGPMGTYQLFAAGAEPIGGMMTKVESVPAPFWLYYFTVDAIDAAADRVRAQGGTVLQGPHEVPGPMWIVQCQDPQGAMFALVSSRR